MDGVSFYGFCFGLLFICYAIAVVVGMVTWQHLSKYAKMIAVLTTLGLATEITSLSILKFGYRTDWLYCWYTPIEFVIIMFTGLLISPSSQKKKLAAVCIFIYMALWAYFFLRQRSPEATFSSYVGGCVIIVFFYVWHLIQMLKDEKNDPKALLICYSTLIYFTGVIPLFSMDKFIAENTAAKQLMIINLILNIVRFNLITAAFLLFNKKSALHIHGQR